MLTLAICASSPSARELKPGLFAAHGAHLKAHRECLKLAGVLDLEDKAYDLANDPSPASLIVIDDPHGTCVAQDIVTADPYFTGGVWSRIDLYEVAGFQGGWSPNHEEDRRHAIERFPDEEIVAPAVNGRNYAVLANFDEGFTPNPEQVEGHQRHGARFADRFMAALRIRHVDTLGVPGNERAWQLCYILRAEDYATADRMTAQDPLAAAGIMHHKTFSIPAGVGSWSR